jgi:ribulose-phosphate 3-epimerase
MPMLKCATSLWSADLANLAAEIHRVEAYSERFHFDVADGFYVPTLLFFPDLVRAVRPYTRRPFEVHLMVSHPLAWVEPFAEAGADLIIFGRNSGDDPGKVIDLIKSQGKLVGMALRIDETVDQLGPYWPELTVATFLGTAMGTRGGVMHPTVPGKIRQARQLLARRSLTVELEADGGLRRETVPAVAAAGADYIVPGSLMFGGDPRELRAWLASL